MTMYIQKINRGMSSMELGAGLEEKMRRINQRKEKYKRSTNNSHKKFICVARKLLYKLCTYRERELFEREFEAYQNSRVYYFVILAHVKIRMTPSERDNYQRNLATLLNAKVHTYNEEIKRTNNKNFINFRFEEIADIQFALKALTLYLENKVDEAIEVIYKKEKGFVLKKQQFQMAINTVAELEERLRSYPEGDLFPYLNEKSKKVETPKQKSSGQGRRAKQEQDEQWVQEKLHRQSSKYVYKREKKKEISLPPRNYQESNKTPLLFLERSFPINPHFYSVLFSYPDPQQSHHFPLDSFKQPSFPLSHYNSFRMPETPQRQAFPQYHLNYQHENTLKAFPQHLVKSEYPQTNPFCFDGNNNLFFDYTLNKKELRPPGPTSDTIKQQQEQAHDSYVI